MAIKKEIWDKARGFYEAGKSINYISRELEISKSTVAGRVKREKWEQSIIEHLKDDVKGLEESNRTIIEQKSNIIEQMTDLEDYQITAIGDLVELESNAKSFIFNTQTLAIIRNNQLLKKNTKQEIIKVNNYTDGRLDSQSAELVEVPLDSADIRNIIESTDKASITLGVNQRHANTTINNTNANQQNNEIEVPQFNLTVGPSK